MGKASSAKKVARAARAGGRVSSGQPRSLLFPGVLLLIMVLGVTLVVYARNERSNQDLGGVPQPNKDHIHQSLAINVCGEEKPVVPKWEPTAIGLHTHGDGVMHIHPYTSLGAGANATLGRFIKSAKEEGGIDFALTDTKLSYLGEKIEEGKTKCKGVSKPVLRVAYWKNVGDAASKPVITTGGFTKLRLTTNGAGFTIYYGDPKADIPRPSNADQLAALGAADGGTATSTTAAAEGSTTTAPAGGSSSSTSTTAGGSTTSSTAG